MLGPKLNKVFRSRWHALFWSASMLLTAYCSIPAADDDAPGPPAVKVAAKGGHKNPWAKD